MTDTTLTQIAAASADLANIAEVAQRRQVSETLDIVVNLAQIQKAIAALQAQVVQ